METQSNYFSNPILYSNEKLVEELKEKTLDMCWNFGSDCHFRFVTGGNEVYFELFLGPLPGFYNDYLARIKNKFIELTETKQLAFSYKIRIDGSEESNVLRATQKNTHSDDYSYIVSDRRVIENANPQFLSQKTLETIIRNNNILFYTGAGISRASDVPAMRELYEQLGLEEGERFLFSLENALNNPKVFASKIFIFHRACLFSPPTEAHLALKELAIFKNIRIITENLDCLHERTGVYPYRINAKELRDEIGGASLLHFDYIICIGLSFDDKGFLGWYKEQNPNGKIIAIDLKQPSYLGDEDFLLSGNFQEILPSIQKNILF